MADAQEDSKQFPSESSTHISPDASPGVPSPWWLNGLVWLPPFNLFTMRLFIFSGVYNRSFSDICKNIFSNLISIAFVFPLYIKWCEFLSEDSNGLNAKISGVKNDRQEPLFVRQLRGLACLYRRGAQLFGTSSPVVAFMGIIGIPFMLLAYVTLPLWSWALPAHRYSEMSASRRMPDHGTSTANVNERLTADSKIKAQGKNKNQGDPKRELSLPSAGEKIEPEEPVELVPHPQCSGEYEFPKEEGNWEKYPIIRGLVKGSPKSKEKLNEISNTTPRSKKHEEELDDEKSIAEADDMHARRQEQEGVTSLLMHAVDRFISQHDWDENKLFKVMILPTPSGEGLMALLDNIALRIATQVKLLPRYFDQNSNDKTVLLLPVLTAGHWFLLAYLVDQQKLIFIHSTFGENNPFNKSRKKGGSVSNFYEQFCNCLGEKLKQKGFDKLKLLTYGASGGRGYQRNSLRCGDWVVWNAYGLLT